MDPEFGAWGDNGCLDFIRTCWDREVDAGSLLPGSFTFEKYFSGRYLGELARRVLLGVLEGLGRPPPSTLSSPDSLTARDVSEVVASTLPGGDQPGLLAALQPDTRSLLQHIAVLLSGGPAPPPPPPAPPPHAPPPPPHAPH